MVEHDIPDDVKRFGLDEAARRTQERKDKLATLKERIRASKLPLLDPFANPEALGDAVLSDLTKVINDLFPAGSVPDFLNREALDHAAYAKSRERVYIGRDEYFTRLDAHAAGDGKEPLVILGESGSGKSALLANWAARYKKAHPDVFVLEHYIGSTPESADWASMLRRIMGELKAKLDIQQEIPDNPDALRSAFPNFLHMAAAKEARMITDHLLPAHQHDALGVGAHRGDPTGKAAIDAVAVALEVHQTGLGDTSRVFGIAVEGHRHRAQRRALLLPDLDDLATGLLRMVALTRQLQAARGQMRIKFSQIRAFEFRREQPFAHVADLVLDLPLLPP